MSNTSLGETDGQANEPEQLRYLFLWSGLCCVGVASVQTLHLEGQNTHARTAQTTICS